MVHKEIKIKESFLQKIYRVFFVEKRLPISFEKRYHRFFYYNVLQKRLRKIANENPVECIKNAETELHILTCDRDLFMAVTACKSFLRFYPDVSVVFHGDESLTNSMCEFLKAAIPFSRVISYDNAEQTLRSKSKIFQLRRKVADRFELPAGYERQRKAWALKVFDFYCLSKSKKVIVMDSDVLFLKRPDEIIEWIETKSSLAFYSVPQFSNFRASHEEFRNLFPNNIPIDSFNGGLYGYDRKYLSVELLSDTVEKLLLKTDYPILGDECFWRAVYSIIPSHPLSFEYYPLITRYYQKNNLLPDLEKAKYVHFICKHRGGIYGNIVKNIMR